MNLRPGPYLQVPFDRGFRYSVIYVCKDGKVAGPADLSEAAACHLSGLGVLFTAAGAPPWKLATSATVPVTTTVDFPVALSEKARRLIEGKPIPRDFKEER